MSYEIMKEILEAEKKAAQIIENAQNRREEKIQKTHEYGKECLALAEKKANEVNTSKLTSIKEGVKELLVKTSDMTTKQKNKVISQTNTREAVKLVIMSILEETK